MKREVVYTIVNFKVIPDLVHYKVFLSKYRKWHLLQLTPRCIEVILVFNGKKHYNLGRK